MNIKIDPVTRIEGHLSVSLQVEAGQVVQAQCAGTMFRGFEIILQGRDPLDAVPITQRICGVCPVSHGIASSLGLETVLGIQAPKNARLLRNLLLGANYIQSHLLHFYHLSALDFIDIPAVTGYTGHDPLLASVRDWVIAEQARSTINPAAPFLPRYAGNYVADREINLGVIGHYLQALRMRSLAHEMVALLGGKAPHVPALIAGGVTSNPGVDRIEAYRSRLNELRDFIDQVYLADVITLGNAFPLLFKTGGGPGNLLSFGGFPEEGQGGHLLPAGLYRNGRVEPLDITQIKEDTQNSWYKSPSGLHPSKGQTVPDPHKADAYSWVKAPRYGGSVVEVGPLARTIISYASGTNPSLSKLLDSSMTQLKIPLNAMFSVYGRHLARAIECKVIADRCETWLNELEPGRPAMSQAYQIPESGNGVGLMEAPRGALGHWVEISNKVIQRYECLVPTTWNCSPRDDRGQPGALEQALAGISLADQKNPLEAMRVVRSFDPCLACAVH